MFKKTLTSLILTLVAFGGFFGVKPIVSVQNSQSIISISNQNEVFAAGWWLEESKKAAETDDEATRKLFNAIATTVNLLIDLLTILVTPAVMLASWLISPDWTSGDLFNLRPTIHSLWVLVSNIVYFIYAILLIVIALATIFNSDNYGYKAMLPKLALGILMVPLTWWMVQFTISLATYVTASVITIPQETMFKLDEVKCSGDSQNCWQNRPSIPKEILFINAPSSASKELLESYNKDNINSAAGKSCSKEICYTPKQFLSNLWWTYGQLIVYAYGVFRISDMKRLDTTWNKVESIIWIIHQGIIGSILFMIFWILVLALATMLFIRAIKLWVYAIFSPLFTIHFVTGGALFWWDNKESFSIKEFLGLAFVPAVVWLALSFWLVIIWAIQSTSTDNPNLKPCTGENIITENPNDENAWCKILWFMGNENNSITKMLLKDDEVAAYKTVNRIMIWGIKFLFYGEPIGEAWVQKVVDEANNSTGVIGNASGTIGTLIVDIIAIVFIWVAFMAAKWVSKAVAAVVDPFEKMGKNIADLGMKLPKYTPLPIPGGSIAGMEKSSWMINQLVDAKFDKDFKSKWIGKRLNEALWGGDTDDITRVRQAVENVNPNSGFKIATEEIQKIRQAGRWESLHRDEAFTQEVKKLMDKYKEGKLDKSTVQNHDPELIKLFDKYAKDTNSITKDEYDIIMARMAWIWKNRTLTVNEARKELWQTGSTWTSTSTSTNNTTITVNTSAWKKPIIKIGDKEFESEGLDGAQLSKVIRNSWVKMKKKDFESTFGSALAQNDGLWVNTTEGNRALTDEGKRILSWVLSSLDKDFIPE